MEPRKIMLPMLLRGAGFVEVVGDVGVGGLRLGLEEEWEDEEAIMARAQARETRKEPVRFMSRRVRKRGPG